MRSRVKIHQPSVQTHLPAHEQAARQQRAALLKPPAKPAPEPAAPTTGRKTWHVEHPNPRSPRQHPPTLQHTQAKFTA